MKKTLIFLGALICSYTLAAQKIPEKSWHLNDYSSDGCYGISLEKAYAFLRENGLKPHSIIVGLLETGVDTAHEDLAPSLWQNKNEIAGNGLDDDNNGYADDMHGWNFLGGPKGNVLVTTSEWTRVYWRYKTMFDSMTIDTNTLSRLQKYEYALWQKARGGVVGQGLSKGKLETIKNYLSNMIYCDSMLKKSLNKSVYDLAVLTRWETSSKPHIEAKEFMSHAFKQFNANELNNTTLINELSNYFNTEEQKIKNENEEPIDKRRSISGNDEADPKTMQYGNNNIWAGNNLHGTHVAGIIGAVRNNRKGIDGIADAVYLMPVRATADGDEYDKDIAAAIRYATDNGAKVINMSFGKSLSPDKLMVDDAVRYALRKDVLIVHAAGNSGRDINNFDNFPNPRFLFSDSIAANWITVGASDCNGYAAAFSNYGKKLVDVFAPGVGIYSTVPGESPYASLDGTSMAAPVVAGVAALLREYFPTLTAVETKKIILQSVNIPPANLKNAAKQQDNSLIKLCLSGGIVNAYTAVKLAYEYTKGK